MTIPCITVLMPVYNGSVYLDQAIQSILHQTFTDFEFLIIDDASTDDSLSIIHSYSDPRIQLICNDQNRGQVASLNKGLKLAHGKYIARMDQDDICLATRFQKQVEFLENHSNVVVVGTLAQAIDSKDLRGEILCMQWTDPELFLPYLLLGDTPIGHPTVMLRRDTVLEVGGYDESFAPAEDYDLWTRLAVKRHRASVILEPLLLHRMHGAQQSSTKAKTQRRNWNRAHQKLVQIFYKGSEAFLLSTLLRRDPTFWSECKTKRKMVIVFQALGEMLMRMQTLLNLPSNEFQKINKIVYRRLGQGVLHGSKIAKLPTPLFYLAFFILSPLLMPGLLQFSRFLGAKWRLLRYGVRS